MVILHFLLSLTWITPLQDIHLFRLSSRQSLYFKMIYSKDFGIPYFRLTRVDQYSETDSVLLCTGNIERVRCNRHSESLRSVELAEFTYKHTLKPDLYW